VIAPARSAAGPHDRRVPAWPDAPGFLSMGLLRHQLPVYSPLPLRSLVPAIRATARVSADSREVLAATLRRRFGAEGCVLCASGTEALRLAIATALRLRPGATRVALPAFSCYDVASAAVANDAQLLLYDIEPATLAPDLNSLERALREGAAVVVVSPLYGIPVDWEAVRERAERHGALVIEDAAQGHGAFWKDRPLGSLGDLAVISFGRGKGWTGGRGGALLLRGCAAGVTVAEEPGATTLRRELSTVAAAAVQSLLGRPNLYGIPLAVPGLQLGATVYHDAPEVSSMPRAASAILHGTREAADAEAAARRSHAAALVEAIRSRDGVAPVMASAGATPGYLRFPLRLARGMGGWPSTSVAFRLGIAPSYPTTLAALVVVRERLAALERCMGAEELARTLVTLPTHTRLTSREREAVVALVDEYVP
jgi:perosamine synthetase